MADFTDRDRALLQSYGLTPWQQREKQGRPDSAYAPLRDAPELPLSPILSTPSDEEYARRAAEWRAENQPTKDDGEFER